MTIAGARTVTTGTENMLLCGNAISTRKYSWFSFLPVSLLFQFRSISNAYFLLTAGIMLIPDVSPINPFSAIAPLCFVLIVSEIREFVEEYQKYTRDVETNSTVVKRLVKNETGSIDLMPVSWESLHPGDLVVLYDRDKIPADIVLAASSSSNFSYVETSNLDGETNLKTREAPSLLGDAFTLIPGASGDEPEDYDFSGLFDHKLVFESANPDMYRFKGTVGDNSLSIGNMMLRGCSMRNTTWAVGVCVYTGHETKAMLNSTSLGVVPSKKTNVERRMNLMVLMVFGCQLLLIMGATLGFAATNDDVSVSWYLDGLSSFSSGFAALSFFVLLNTIIPMSMWVSLEVLKFFQASLMQADACMKDPVRNLGCVAHAKNLHEELGQVTHVFTDKTGTLTCNRMEFKGCAVNGRVFAVDKNVVADFQDPSLVETSLADKKPKKKRRELGFAGAIPIDEKLLELISSSIDAGVDSVESEFFKCIALCHSCERVQKHDHAVKAKAKSRKGGWFARFRRKTVPTAGATESSSSQPHSILKNIGVSRVYASRPETPDHDRVSTDSVDAKVAKYMYQSTSPDEAALVSSAADIGYIFHKRLPSAVQVDIGGVAYVYEVVHQVAFTSDRRMMSVIVRLTRKGADAVSDGRIVVYTKGADSSVIPLCDQTAVVRHTQWAVEIFADKGLRTLCLARREWSVAEWAAFESRIKKASEDLESRDAKVAEIDAEIETNMTLLGCTAVEDKLQPGVHETVAALRAAGIAVCMITGDKRETAINIARSCKLVNSEHNVYTMSTQDNMYGGGNFIHVDSLAMMVGDGRADPLWGMTTEGRVDAGAKRDSAAGRKLSLPMEESAASGIAVREHHLSRISLSPLATESRIAALSSGRSGMMPRVEAGDSPVAHPSPSAVRKEYNKFCIVLDGAALSILLANPSQTKKLLAVMAHPQCEAAVFCRVNPKQKGLIVKSCRSRLAAGCVLAIGDGANDISMIKEAHVGIGIYGEEGWQAAGSADYAITKFKDLYRLLFVHGRWNYVRITFFISFFMYKNYAFTFLQFWMASLSAWSGLSVLDDVCVLVFNSVFMVAPLFAAGLFDKDISPDADRPSKGTINHPPSLTDDAWYVHVVPKLYGVGQRNELFRAKRVMGWLVVGLIHSLVVFFGAFSSWGFSASAAIEPNGFNASLPMIQQSMYTALLMALSLLHAMMIRDWNILYAAMNLLLHVVLYIVFTAVYDTLTLQPYSYIAGATFTNWNFWFTFFITLSVCVLPLVILKTVRRTLKPTLVDVIKSKVRRTTDLNNYAKDQTSELSGL